MHRTCGIQRAQGGAGAVMHRTYRIRLDYKINSAIDAIEQCFLTTWICIKDCINNPVDGCKCTIALVIINTIPLLLAEGPQLFTLLRVNFYKQ